MPYEVGQSASIVEKAKSKTANIPPEISTGTTTNTPSEISTGTTTNTPPEISTGTTTNTPPEISTGTTTNTPPEISTGTTTNTPPEISTGTTTTTPPGTTMPPVNSSHLGFNFACPTDHFCEYTYVAPYYNRTWYNTEEKKYHNYASEFDNIEKIINSNFNESFTVYDDVTKQLNHLNETVMNITGLLNSIEKDQNNISAALDCMEYKLIQAQVFLDDVQTRVGSCFYQQCYLVIFVFTRNNYKFFFQLLQLLLLLRPPQSLPRRVIVQRIVLVTVNHHHVQ
uniref:t-SNARE coiled-coil homology domain-containing protein n=1 Tax=Heterorhabditis bacteriophora TaxID=37862 RepID=A0A1I7X533_HETBA